MIKYYIIGNYGSFIHFKNDKLFSSSYDVKFVLTIHEQWMCQSFYSLGLARRILKKIKNNVKILNGIGPDEYFEIKIIRYEN